MREAWVWRQDLVALRFSFVRVRGMCGMGYVVLLRESATLALARASESLY